MIVSRDNYHTMDGRGSNANRDTLNGTQDRNLGGVVGIGAAQQNREHKRPKGTGRTREMIIFTM